jgi:trimeric autotransporter adhesin
VALVTAATLVGVRSGASSARSSAHAPAAGGFAALPVPLRGLALTLAGVGYGSSLRPPGPSVPSADGNRVSYPDGAFTQWFENGPLGLEQGFRSRI